MHGQYLDNFFYFFYSAPLNEIHMICHALSLPAIRHCPFSPPRDVMVTNVCSFLK
jgi:hypothetical protein